jgi:hypothetical protein
MMACKETTEAHLECEEPTSVDMESEAKHREVSKEHAAMETGKELRKRDRGPRRLWIREEVGCCLQEGFQLCKSSMAQGKLHQEGLDQEPGRTRNP